MRTPSELMELYVHHEQNNTCDQFFTGLTYEEATMICMVIELQLKNPSLNSQRMKTYLDALEYCTSVRKKILERN